MSRRRGQRRPPPSRKTRRQLLAMRHAGRILARAVEAIREAAAPGVTALELDQLAEDLIRSYGARPSFKGLYNYPATICVAPNDVVVHSIPTAAIVLREGDIIGVDLGAQYDGMHADVALTIAVGEITEQAQRLLAVTQAALEAGIAQACVGHTVQDIAAAVEQVVRDAGCSAVRVLSGHGIGAQVHEAPSVPNFVDRAMFSDYDTKLLSGMTLAIEPMVNEGTAEVKLDPDGWTYRTADGKLSAHFEHTVQITRGEPRLLTLGGEQPEGDGAEEGTTPTPADQGE